MRIRLIALDVDGVLTNGEVRFDEDGRERNLELTNDLAVLSRVRLSAYDQRSRAS